MLRARWILPVIAIGCTPAERAGMPVVSTVDAVGKGLASVMHWCDDAGADPRAVLLAQEALERGHIHQAAAWSAIMLRELAKSEAVPEDVVVTLRLVEGALAAQAVADGMRALSHD